MHRRCTAITDEDLASRYHTHWTHALTARSRSSWPSSLTGSSPTGSGPRRRLRPIAQNRVYTRTTKKACGPLCTDETAWLVSRQLCAIRKAARRRIIDIFEDDAIEDRHHLQHRFGHGRGDFCGFQRGCRWML